MIKLSDHAFQANGITINHELSVFQRILLGSDGTMTNLLEIILGEELCANKICEEVDKAPSDIPELDLNTGQRFLRRTVTLQGRVSGINYLYADSLIAPDHLDKKFSEMLLSTKDPIGRIWDLFQIETYKSLVEWGEAVARDTSKYFSVGENELFLYRTYLVFSSGRPIMKITEQFPRRWFADY